LGASCDEVPETAELHQRTGAQQTHCALRVEREGDGGNACRSMPL
jgi:hypothetical protein